MSLQRLLGGGTEAFLCDHYQRLPFSKPGGAGELMELGTWDVLVRILTAPQADAMVVRRNERYAGPTPTTVDEAQRLVADGYTLLVKQAERHDERLGELARGLERDLACPVNIHLYCTPATQYGFAWHYDAEEVFIVQTTGRKEYSLRKNTVHPWPLEETLPADMQYEREIMPMMKCLLSAGDWLYIPSGYWHMGAASETAISLSIGIMPRTGVSLLDAFRRQAIDSLLWRQRLPVLGAATTLSDEQLLEQLLPLAEQLADDLKRQFTSRAFLKEAMHQFRGIAPE
jgi:ribosomal protein L16 Arg81 hydroxylase